MSHPELKAEQAYVDHAYACGKRGADRLSSQGIDRAGMERRALGCSNGAEAVDGKTKPVHDTAEQCLANGHRCKSSARHQPGTGPNARRVAQGDRQQVSVLEPHNLHRQRRLAGSSDNFAHLSDARLRADRLDEQTDNPHHPTREGSQFGLRDDVETVGERETVT